MDITENQVKNLLDELYAFKDKVRESGNSKYIRISNKDILFAVLAKVIDLENKTNKQEIALTKMKAVVYIGVPTALTVIGYLLVV